MPPTPPMLTHPTLSEHLKWGDSHLLVFTSIWLIPDETRGLQTASQLHARSRMRVIQTQNCLKTGAVRPDLRAPFRSLIDALLPTGQEVQGAQKAQSPRVPTRFDSEYVASGNSFPGDPGPTCKSSMDHFLAEGKD